MRYHVLFRGHLLSCNYACPYCPFAKRKMTREEVNVDRRSVQRFVSWVDSLRGDQDELAILFTPWGEALVRRYYQRAMLDLSHMPHVTRVAAQTNLSYKLDWLRGADPETIALWSTWHPGEVELGRFVAQCERLHEMGVRHSVGVVGLKDHANDIVQLRDLLPESTYLWINAYKRVPDYYSGRDLARYGAIDPLFSINNTVHESLGHACRAGETSFTVDGEGVMRRCHFIDAPIGTIYEGDFRRALRASACSNATCRCHIGYVHMHRLGLYEVFEGGVLERIPSRPIWSARSAVGTGE